MQISEIKIIQCSICHKTDTIHLPIHSIFQKNLHGVLTASGTIHLNIDQFLPITKLPCTRRDQAAPLPQANRSGEDPPGSAYLHPPGLDHKKMTVIHHVRLCFAPSWFITQILLSQMQHKYGELETAELQTRHQPLTSLARMTGKFSRPYQEKHADTT